MNSDRSSQWRRAVLVASYVVALGAIGAWFAAGFFTWAKCCWGGAIFVRIWAGNLDIMWGYEDLAYFDVWDMRFFFGDFSWPRWYTLFTYINVDGNIRAIEFPLWVLAIVPAMVIVFLHLAARRRAARGGCVRCGYDLRGTVEPRCPECGTPFDPARVPRAVESEEARARRYSPGRARLMALVVCYTIAAGSVGLWLVSGFFARLEWYWPSAFLIALESGNFEFAWGLERLPYFDLWDGEVSFSGFSWPKWEMVWKCGKHTGTARHIMFPLWAFAILPTIVIVALHVAAHRRAARA